MGDCGDEDIVKITDYSRSTPGLILGTASNANAIGGVSVSSNSPALPGSILVAISSNMAAWRDALSFGSNTNDVSSTGTMGSSPSNTRADHVHRGVHAVTAAGSNALYGDVNLVAGSGLGITTSGQNVRFDATASAIAAGTYFLASSGGQGVRASLGNLGSSETINLANGLYQLGTLNANCTISFTGWTNGTYCEVGLRLTEDGTGGWTPTFTGVTWLADTAPTHTTTALTSTEYVFWSTDGGATIIGGLLGGSAFVLSHPSVSSNSFSSNAVLTNDASVAITMPQFGTLHFSAPFFSEVVTDSAEIVWHGNDVVHDLVRLY